jgi:NCS2 family nucleobase:cation symporter-2
MLLNSNILLLKESQFLLNREDLNMKELEKRDIGVDERLGVGQSLFLGLQSVLACNLFLGPVVIIGALAMGVEDASALIAMTFFACGIATIIQSAVFLNYPVIQGMSFATIGAFLAIAGASDWATAFGSVIPAAIVIIIVGFTGLFSIIVRKFIPPFVAGTVIVCIGVNLMFVSWTSIINAAGDVGTNFLEAGVSFAVLLAFIFMGNKPTLMGKILRTGCVVYAMALGTVVSSFFGHVDLTPVKEAAWFAFPNLLPFGMPKFDLTASLVMTFILLVVLVESLGSWFTISVLSGSEMTDKRINKGVIGEGLGCLIGSLVGGIPVTSYGSNAGVVAVTRVFSKWAAVGAGALCILMALCPKLMSLIAIIPATVVWGVFALVCTLIMMSGYQSIQQYPLHDHNSMVVGLSVLATIGSSLMPAQIIASMPQIFGYIIGAPIVVGALSAILFNIILPKPDEGEVKQVDTSVA